MDSMVEIYLNRASNEILAAESLNRLSENQKDKKNFELASNITFYSSVISHSYYSIFYSAKAILLTTGIKTEAPNVHKATLDKFKEKFVDNGILDVKLLEIYKKLIVRADDLLEIYKIEKGKRGNFTYQTIAQANKEPANESLQNAKFFVANINKVVKNN
ncbi:HEPN domain-containing protein [Candidatus Woesearchaeota archaeon]|nr:HEPN domain-containing protein [Candidatus Woesearchaeota archaeon]